MRVRWSKEVQPPSSAVPETRRHPSNLIVEKQDHDIMLFFSYFSVVSNNVIESVLAIFSQRHNATLKIMHGVKTILRIRREDAEWRRTRKTKQLLARSDAHGEAALDRFRFNRHKTTGKKPRRCVYVGRILLAKCIEEMFLFGHDGQRVTEKNPWSE
jgi:hypothetical protein